jgi:hypothetical protein
MARRRGSGGFFNEEDLSLDALANCILMLAGLREGLYLVDIYVYMYGKIELGMKSNVIRDKND